MKVALEYGQGAIDVNVPDDADIFIPGVTGSGSALYSRRSAGRKNPGIHPQSNGNGAVVKAGT